MIETLIAFFVAAVCAQGEPINNWHEYVHDVDLYNVTASVRLSVPGRGVRWLYVFDDRVLFLSRPDSIHGHCARELDD